MDSSNLYRRSALLAAGYTERELRRWLSAGELSILRRGSYTAGAPPEEAHARHRLLVDAAFAELDRRHDGLVATMASLDREDWNRKAPVWFGSSVEALPTSPGDIWGWLNDHYLEHVPQVHDLHQEWVASRTR